MTDDQLIRLLVMLMVLLSTANLFGALAVRLRQPRVAGELVGGLLLGPTALGAALPAAQSWLFPTDGPVGSTLGAVQQLGMLMLMFLAGLEVRRLVPRENARVTGWIVLTGLVVPLGLGLALFQLVHLDDMMGPAGDRSALALVLASSIAVTSIPVISRIMLDLGILGTSFAAIVLSAAIVGDLVLYVVIAVALGMAHSGRSLAGLPDLLGVGSGPGASVYYVLATVVLFAVALLLRPAASRLLLRRQGPAEWQPSSATACCLLVLLAGAVAALALGVQPMFGAFLAGFLMARVEAAHGVPLSDGFRVFALAFFLPFYFGAVGLRLDLVHDLRIPFTVGFLALACAVKLGSVYLGARLGRETRPAATNFAIAMNARGGPGIVLAGLAFGAGIVDDELYTTLIVLAIVTSLIAGVWLRFVVDRGRTLRQDEVDRPAAVPAGRAVP